MTVFQDSEGNTSSKRIFGGIGISIYFIIVSIVAFISVQSGNDIGTNVANLITGIGITSGGLLAAGVVEGFANKKEVIK